MPLCASDKTLIGILALLTITSLGVKGVMGPTVYAPPREGPASVEEQVLTKFRKQGFSTSVRHLRIQSSIVYARRGTCVLSARDASGGDAAEAIAFADDARNIGPIRYFYRGAIYTSPPSVQAHLAVIQSSLLRAFGMRPPLHVPVAVAATAACANSTFGIEDIQTAS